MRDELAKLLRETTLTTIAFAIALGWALFQVAEGLAHLVTIAFETFEPGDFDSGAGILSWRIGNHLLSFHPLLEGLLELGFVLAVILVVRRKFSD